MRSRTLWACCLVAALCVPTVVWAGTPASDYKDATEALEGQLLTVEKGVIEVGTKMAPTDRLPVRVGSLGGVAGGGEPVLVYNNEAGLLLDGVAGIEIGDDVETVAPVGSGIASYMVTVWGGGDGTGAGFNVTTRLYDGCPRDGGSVLAGSENTEALPDDDVYEVVVDLTGANVTIPDELWVSVTVSTDTAGWLVGATATLGYTDDIFDYPLFPCTTYFGGDPYSGFNAKIYATGDVEPEYVAFQSAGTFAGLYGGDDDACTALDGCGDGLELGTACEVVADDLQLIVSSCDLVRYEVETGGYPDDLGNPVPFEIEFQLYTNDGGFPGDPIAGTECCYNGVGDGFIETAVCTVDEGVVLPGIVWLGIADGSIDAGLLISDVPAIVGDNADCFNVFEDGLWSGCVYTFAGGEGCEGGACGAFNAKVVCAGTIPTGACCDVDADPQCTEGVMEHECDGRWVEDGVCDPDPFTPPCGAGACCLPDGSCLNLLEAECVAQSGHFQFGEMCGEGDQACPPTPCLNSTEPCDEGHDSPGCNDPECCARVCALDPFCCSDYWEESIIPGTGCVALAEAVCGECAYDTCENAAVLETFPATFVGNNSYCTTDCDDLEDTQDGEAWISFTLETADNVRISYCGSDNLFNDAYDRLYDSCPCGEVAAEGNVDICPTDGNPLLEFHNLAAGTYYYPIMSALGAAGRWEITVETFEVDRPENDECAMATVAPELPYTFTGTNIDSTNDCPEIEDSNGEVWLSFTLDECSDVQVDYCGSDPVFGNAWIVMFNECPCTDVFWTAEVLADECADTNPAMMFYGLGAGTYYYPVLWEDGAAGTYNITVTATPVVGTPDNDLCEDADHAELVSEVPYTFTGTNVDSCNDCSEVADSDGEVWVSFTLPAPGDVALDYCGTNPAFGNAWLVLFNDCPCGEIFTYAEVDLELCDDNNPGMHFLDLPAGTYYYPIMEEEGSSGDYTVTVTYTEDIVPDNDICQNATYAALEMETPHTFTGSNVNGFNECEVLADAEAGDVWISFTIPEDADVTIDYCDSVDVFETVFRLVFNNCPCDEAYTLGVVDWEVCDDGNPSVLIPNLPAGTYFHPVIYDTVNGAVSENYSITVTATPPIILPDDCDEAIAISEGDTEFSTIGATTDGPAHPGHESCDAFDDDQINQDVWYTFSPSCVGTVTVSTCDQADFDTRLAIYDTAECPVLAGDLIQCNDDGDGCGGYTSVLEAYLPECGEYLLRVGGFDAAIGTGTLSISVECDEPQIICGGTDPEFVESSPAHDGTLWRAGTNYFTLTFDSPLGAAPAAGEVEIRELIDGGTYGPDLSGSFTFSVDGSTLVVQETTPALQHGTWYGISNAAWGGAGDFMVHMLLQIGDANGDRNVLPNDLSLINSDIPNFSAAVDSRLDINGDGRHLPNDLSVANAQIPSFAVAKPAGH